MNQPLAALASPDPRPTTAQSWHTQAGFDTFLAQQVLTAFSPRSCRLPIRKAACHTCVRFCAHPSPHAARRVRHPQRSSGTDLSWFASSPSRILLQELRRRTGIVVHSPAVSQRPIYSLKVLPASGEPSNNVTPRHVMATLPDAGSNPPQRQLSGLQSQIHDLDAVTSTFPDSKSPHVAQSTERRLEREI
jgi:hypothetical protein